MAKKEKGTEISFGKIALYGGKKINEVTVTVELRTCGGDETFTIGKNGEHIPTGQKTPEYQELAICGNIWNSKKTDIVYGGQCLDTIAEYVHDPFFEEIHGLWKKYHLNGMHAGTPEQEEAVKEWREKTGNNGFAYDEICEMLKEKGLYEVNFTGVTTGKVYNNEPYKYGHSWVVEQIPEDVLKRINEIIDENRKY